MMYFPLRIIIEFDITLKNCMTLATLSLFFCINQRNWNNDFPLGLVQSCVHAVFAKLLKVQIAVELCLVLLSLDWDTTSFETFILSFFLKKNCMNIFVVRSHDLSISCFDQCFRNVKGWAQFPILSGFDSGILG